MTTHLRLVVSRSLPRRTPPKSMHLCPECGRRVLWALWLCAVCSWRGEPLANSEYQETKRLA